jgi:glycosyltransferase involved in cell wall biosynthesis
MRIGIDASRAEVARRTGTELYALRLIQALLALDADHRFRLYLRRTPGRALWQELAAEAGDRVTPRIIPFPRLWTHVRLGWELARQPPDVLFVPAHVLPLWTRPPAVVTVHDLGYLYFPEAHPPGQRRYLHWSTRHSARLARIVIADSEVSKRDLVTHYGVAPEKVVVAYPGFDEGLAPVTDEVAIRRVMGRYGLAGRYLLHLGTLQPRKNLGRLVEAFAGLEDQAVQLVLAGKRGWLYDELFRTVQRLGLEQRVLFPGYIAESDKAALLSGATAYVFPSLYEGFGFPALEAQACDTPLICADDSSLPEVAGEGALCVDPTDVPGWTGAMSRVLSDAGLRAELVARGRRNRARFSWRACAEAVLVALEIAAGKDGEGRRR